MGDAIILARTESIPEGPPCCCGRKGWAQVARCGTLGCAGRSLAKLKLAASRPDPNAGGEGVSVGIYEDPEMMLAFMPFFPNMWDETDDEARGQSMQEDNEYYESFER